MVSPSAFSSRDLLSQQLDNQRRQALRRFIQQQQLRIPHQRPADRQHLLLAARQEAAALVAAFRQHRKQLVHPVDRPMPRPLGRARRDVQVLPHAELGEDSPVLRHEPDAGARDAVRRPARNVRAAPYHAPRPRRRQPHDRAHGGRLADPVASQQADALALLHFQRDAEQHLAQAVGSANVLNRKQHGHGALPSQARTASATSCRRRPA